ncbi:Calcineurin-like_phosphoesterase [Hexamita inflata]|uniref:Calcineurin-like_phosphoesterase n=1 Tax=Hexamita inflata TaxID=28002 RepID=A0ABP1IJ23_9EUKA
MSQTNNQQQNNVQNQQNDAINITFISDTHERHQYLNSELYNGDIIVHTGDLTNGEINPYDMTPVINFLTWFSSLPYKYKIFIGGNHEFPLMHQVLLDILVQFPNVIYLNKLLNYGIPFVSHLNGWAFNIPSRVVIYTEKYGKTKIIRTDAIYGIAIFPVYITLFCYKSEWKCYILSLLLLLKHNTIKLHFNIMTQNILQNTILFKTLGFELLTTKFHAYSEFIRK